MDEARIIEYVYHVLLLNRTLFKSKILSLGRCNCILEPEQLDKERVK